MSAASLSPLPFSFRYYRTAVSHFKDMRNCSFPTSYAGVPGWALLFRMEQKATVEQVGALLDCRSFLQDEWLQRSILPSQTPPGFG